MFVWFNFLNESYRQNSNTVLKTSSESVPSIFVVNDSRVCKAGTKALNLWFKKARNNFLWFDHQWQLKTKQFFVTLKMLWGQTLIPVSQRTAPQPRLRVSDTFSILFNIIFYKYLFLVQRLSMHWQIIWL